MANQIELIVPPISETAISGFMLGANRQVRGHVLTVKFYRTQPQTRLFRDDKPVDWVKASAQHRKLAHHIAATYRHILSNPR